MKLKNKLLPFVGIAALSATVAPIALTSCGSKTSDGTIDLREWYSPTIEKHAYDVMTSDEAANLYFCGSKDATWGDWLDEDDMNERLLQDYLFGSSMYVQYCEQNAIRTNSKNYSQTLDHLNPKQASDLTFNLTGIDGIVGMKSKNVQELYAKDSGSSKVTYNKYNVSISDVRVSHANKYDEEGDYEEVPTISFQLDFDIDYVINGKFYNGLDGNNIYFNTSVDPLESYLDTKMDVGDVVVRPGDLFTTTTTQNHKGSLTVANMPIKLSYEYCYEVSSNAWTLNFDTDAIIASETISTIPFAVYGTDNITYTTESTYNDVQDKNSGTKVNNFDYYSNMLWEKLMNSTITAEAEEVYKKAYAEAQAQSLSKEDCVAYATLKQKEWFITTGKAEVITDIIGYINSSFLETVSYYLISVECKD